MACECVGPYLRKVRRIQELLTEVKNLFTCDISELKNATLTATQWQLPLRSIKSRNQGARLAPTVAEARYIFWRRFDKFRTSAFLSGGAGLTLVDSNAPEIDNISVAMMASETSHNFKWRKQQQTFELQLQHGNDCAVAMFEGNCKHPHFEIFKAFPPIHGPPAEGEMLDFLGISSSILAYCEESRMALYPPGRSFACAWLQQPTGQPRTWPMLDEEYLEWADVLSSARQASVREQPFRMAEVGAGTYGIWASRAAKAFLRHAPPWASCELLLVEPFVMGDGSALRTHVQKNFPENRCKFQVETSKLTTAGELKALLSTGEPWDLVDIDAQGWEKPFLEGILGWLQHRVRRLHISTHTRKIHWTILEWLNETGWTVWVHYPTYSLEGFKSIGLPAFLSVDGHISAVSNTAYS